MGEKNTGGAFIVRKMGIPFVFIGGKRGEGMPTRSLEEYLMSIAEFFRENRWDPRPCADLAVLGMMKGKVYVMNDVSDYVMGKLKEMYGDKLCMNRPNRLNMRKVTVLNLLSREPGGVILEAEMLMQESAHGYCRLFPTYFCLHSSDIDVLMSTLMRLKMLKIRDYPDLQWMHRAYDRMR